MGLAPKIEKKKGFLLKKCSKCGQSFGPENFAPTKSIFYADGVIPICNDCLESYLEEEGYSWAAIDKVCQYADIPFSPPEWTRVFDMNPQGAFGKYAEIFLGEQYQDLGWGDYYQEYKRLKEEGIIEQALPLIEEEQRKELKSRWGANYDDEGLLYLENLYKGLMATQNVSGALQVDQALKLCKMSYEIDSRIRSGEDFDKILASYDKLVRIANFTPKNAKNANDFDSVGELFRWLEKRGWKNQYYDGVARDIVDETIKNIQAWNQRLYTEESGIGDEITRRIEALKTAKQLEDNYFIVEGHTQDELDKYQNDAFDRLFSEEEEDFQTEVDE